MPKITNNHMLAQIPTTGIDRYITDLVISNGITYTETHADRLASTITQLSGDDIEMDSIEKNLIALEREGIIPKEFIVQIHINYLREKFHV